MKIKIWTLTHSTSNHVADAPHVWTAGSYEGILNQFDQLMRDNWQARAPEDFGKQPYDDGEFPTYSYPGNPYDAVAALIECNGADEERWQIEEHEIEVPDPLEKLKAEVKAYDDEMCDMANDGHDARPPEGDDYNEIYSMVMGSPR